MPSDLTAEKIAELKRLWDIANLGSLEVTSDCDDDWAIVDHRGECQGVISFLSTAIYYAALHNAFPDLIAALEAAQAERDERTTMAARAQEAMRYLLNGLPATDAIWAAYGNADSARAWLAARDARLKAEGAAEWLECHRNDDWLAVDQRERFEQEAAELRRKGTV